MTNGVQQEAGLTEGGRGGAARLIPPARASRTSESAGYLLRFNMQRVMTRAIGDQPGHPFGKSCHGENFLAHPSQPSQDLDGAN